MKPEIKKLARLIQLALQNNTGNSVSEAAISEALDALEASLRLLPCLSVKPVIAEKSLHLASSTLSNLVYNLGNGSFSKSSINIKMVAARANILYNEVNGYLDHYRPARIPGQARCNLLPLNSFFKTAACVARMLQEAFPADDLCKLLLPCIPVQKTRVMPFHRWLWWSQFFAPFINRKGRSIPPLQDVLTALNFNTPVYIDWLRQKLKNELLQKGTPEEKLGYLKDLRNKYRLMPSREQFVFHHSELSVKRSLTGIIKAEARDIRVAFRQVQTQAPSSSPARIATTLSVPQLALLIRLLVDSKIINQQNHSALLKNIAMIMHTSKTASISPESLRVKYYTPDNASMNIVKDHLINMINCLRTY